MRCRLILLYPVQQSFQRLHDPINVFTNSQTTCDKNCSKLLVIAVQEYRYVIATAYLAYCINVACKIFAK